MLVFKTRQMAPPYEIKLLLKPGVKMDKMFSINWPWRVQKFFGSFLDIRVFGKCSGPVFIGPLSAKVGLFTGKSNLHIEEIAIQLETYVVFIT